MPEPVDRYRGSLLGLAIGDALGTALEFRPPGTFTPIDRILGGGPFRLQPGQWTDDTAMALCLTASLVECQGFDPLDQMKRYWAWYREGYMSCTGNAFDIGLTVKAALHRFESTGDPYSGSTDPRTAGNGSLMRLAPVPLAYARNLALAIEKAAESSRTTHASEEAIDACRLFASVLVDLAGGKDRPEALAAILPDNHRFSDQPLAPRIAEIASGSYASKQPPAIRGTGYVVESLEAAQWAFNRSTTFREGALLAVNLGNDADTTGAIYGQLAGAHYGVSAIPEEWRALVAWQEQIETLADKLYDLSKNLV